MGKFTEFKNPKSSLFRGVRIAGMEPSWPINGNAMFPVPSKKDPITEYIVHNMKLQGLLKLQRDFGSLSSLRVEPPRTDRLFKIRRVKR